MMLLYGCLIGRITGAWSHPAVIYAVFWFALTILPLVGVWSIPVEPWAMVYIFATVVVFGLHAFCYDWKTSIEIAERRRETVKNSSAGIFVALFFLMQVCTISCVFANIAAQGFSLSEFVTDPIRASNRYLVARYTGTIETNVFSQVGIIINYIAAPIGGMIIAQQKTVLRSALVIVFAFVPSVLHMIVYSDKGTLFLVGAYFFAGVLVARVMRGDTALLNIATFKAGAAAVLLLIPVLIFSMLSRGGGDWKGSEQITKVFFYLNSYAFGHLFAFSDWFTNYFFEATSKYTNPLSSTSGFFTFMGIGRMILPGYRLPPGIFDEYFSVPNVVTSNIYTMFRPLIVDFGLVGSLVFMFVWGLGASLSYNMMLRKTSPALSQSIFILTIGMIYTSYIISLLIWNSIYVSITGVAVLIVINKRLRRESSVARGGLLATRHT
jgi:oligosaccharide repeat unit polymerase